MIEQRDAEYIRSFAQPFGQDAVFGAWCDIAGRMIMRACDVKSR